MSILNPLVNSEKARYVAKLEAVGLTLKDDLYAKESVAIFKTDVTCWPPVKCGHIFAYFLMRPGLYFRTAPVLETTRGLQLFPE